MNRQILVDGAVNNDAQDQANLTADQGHILTYDLNGNRLTDTYFGRQAVATNRPYARGENGDLLLLDENGNPQYGWYSIPSNEGNSGSAEEQIFGMTFYSEQLGTVTETYTYDRANCLKTVTNQGVNPEGAPAGPAHVLDVRKYDAAGRLIQSGPTGALDYHFVKALTGQDLNASGFVTKKTYFNANGQAERNEVVRADGAVVNNVYIDQQDAMGNVLASRMVDANGVTHSYTKTYQKFDSYVEASAHGVRSDNTERPSNSTSTFDANGNLIKVSETKWPADNPEASSAGVMERIFSNDTNGVVLKKVQEGNVLKQLVLSGAVLTTYGMGVDNSKPLDEDGEVKYVAQGAFGLTFKGINSRSGVGSTYTIREGDTLRSIALNVWGDASLWWKIADANGLSTAGPDGALNKGVTISLPGQISGVHNNADTLRPYDPTEAIGDTTPNMPARPADEGACGGFGMVIMMAIAMIVTYFAPEVGASMMEAMMSAAAISVVTQVIGVAVGAQDKFSWKSVAIAAISAGVAEEIGVLGITDSPFLNKAISYGLANMVTQGIGVATGLQKSFDWKGVAVAAVSAGVEAKVGQALGPDVDPVMGKFLGKLASASSESLIRNGKLSMNDIAMNAFGSLMGAGLSQGREKLWAFAGGTGSAQGAGMPGATSTAQEDFRRAEIQQQNAGAGALVESARPLTFEQDRAMRAAALNPIGLPRSAIGSTPDSYRNGMDVQSDSYDGRYQTATVQKGQGPMAALAGLGLDDKQQRAGYGYLLATGQVKLDRNGVPIVQPGQELTIDTSDTRYSKVAGQAIAQESGLRAQREQIAAAAQASQQQQSWDNMRMAWGGRTGPEPLWSAGSIPADMPPAAASGRYFDYTPTDANGNVTGPAERQWVSDQPGTGWLEGVGNAAKSIASFVDGAVQLGVNGVIAGMGARPASGLAALPALAIGGFEAYKEVQADLQERWTPDSNNPGAIAIKQMAGEFFRPVAQGLADIRNASEQTIGDGWTTIGVTGAQAVLEVAGLVGGVATTAVGRTALGGLGSSAASATSALIDLLPGGSGSGPRTWGFQVGAVGDLSEYKVTLSDHPTALVGSSVAGTVAPDAELARRLLEITQEGHAVQRHGGSITDEQLIMRARTGVAPDGSFSTRDGQISVPPSASAFNSDELLVRADTYVRENYLERAIAFAPAGAKRIVVNGIEYPASLGRSFDRISNDVNSFGPLNYHQEVSRITGVFDFDATNGRWQTNTIYPSNK